MGWIWVAAIAIAAIIFYFWATAGNRPNAHARWLIAWKYAHRGLHDDVYPENSMPAFKAAMEAGFGIELDVHLSKDGEVIVFHDDNLKRMTGIDGRPEDYTRAELADMRLDGSEWGIPTLREVFDLVQGRVPILIETKSLGLAGALEPALYEMLKTYEGPYAVQSFSPFSMGWFKRFAPKVLRGQLSGRGKTPKNGVPSWKILMVKLLLTDIWARPNFISYKWDHISAKVVQRLRKKGVMALAWTVHNEWEARQVKPFCGTIIFEGFRPRLKSAE